MNTDDALVQLEGETQARTREELADLVALSGNLINLFRRALPVVQNAAELDDDFERLRLLLIMRTTGSVQAGRSLILRGYYVQGLASARSILEDIAWLMYFTRRREKASDALADSSFSVAIRNAFEEHEKPEDGEELVRLYSLLSQAAHPSALSMNLHIDEGQPRIQEYSFDRARDSFIYLTSFGQHVLRVVRDLLVDSGDGDDWLPLFEQLEQDAEAWNAAQSQ